VKWFFDTSVLIAAFLEDHEHHESSLAAFVAADKKHAGCAAHTLAELYSALTRLPGRHRLSGDQVLLFLEAIEERLAIVSLDSDDYFSTLRVSAAGGIVGGMVYDALIARCAIKGKAETIYTWNLDHFRRLGADVAKRVRTPQGKD
jgi:predicted nucleic acid-binding protein